MGDPQAAAGWTAVVPVKPLASAKSRLAVAGVSAGDLALAFLDDVLAALAATPRVSEVIVATSDVLVADAARTQRARAVDDTGHPGINAAARWAGARREPGTRVLVLVSDLPCLTPASLSHVLDAASGPDPTFVADADGTGTTMWLAADLDADGPHFGPDSRAAHRAHGAVDLVAQRAGRTGPLLPARLDVDTLAALERAREVGLGPTSSALLAAAPAPRPLTVLRADPEVVVVVDESGRTSRLAADVVRDAGWRTVQAGQRLLVADAQVRPGG